MSIPHTWPQVLDFFGMPLVIEPSQGQLSSDAGLLPIRQFDERIGLSQAFADALDDLRDANLTKHTFLEMVRSRVYGILAGYEDQNDHKPSDFVGLGLAAVDGFPVEGVSEESSLSAAGG
jgi:hypothetical protein